jgi:hypothetical protein
MATTTQYNPNAALNARLAEIGLSKTVYALVTPETEAAKMNALGYESTGAKKAFMSQFREAWTGKQDAYHREFFDEWSAWSSPVVDLDRANYPFQYPTAGASEPIRHLIYSLGLRGGNLHFFRGEYEGFKAIGEAVNAEFKAGGPPPIELIEWDRKHWHEVKEAFGERDLFFVSQPSAIDGNIWDDFNAFVATMPDNSVVADITYVGAVSERCITARFDLNAPAIRNIVFSLSKPFGAYYDRIGGMFARTTDLGMFANVWFKSLTAISIGRRLMAENTVFEIPERYRGVQFTMTAEARVRLGIAFYPSDVYMLAHADANTADGDLAQYLRRDRALRVCLTPGMAHMIGTAV